jgi:hypothetical protein
MLSTNYDVHLSTRLSIPLYVCECFTTRVQAYRFGVERGQRAGQHLLAVRSGNPQHLARNSSLVQHRLTAVAEINS